MRPYLSAFRIRFINGLQYRASALGEILSRCMWAFMEILAFQALYKTGESGFLWSFPKRSPISGCSRFFISCLRPCMGMKTSVPPLQGNLWLIELLRPAGLIGVGSAVGGDPPFIYSSATACPSFRSASLLPDIMWYAFCLKHGADYLSYSLLFSGSWGCSSFAMLMYISMFYTLLPSGVENHHRHRRYRFFLRRIDPATLFPGTGSGGQ